MEWQEFELHSARRQLIKATGHLVDVRKALFATLQHTGGFANSNPTTLSIEANIHTLLQGVNETIKFCAIAADSFKSQMKDPDAEAPPIFGTRGLQLTPIQRQLAMEGVEFKLMPEFIPTKHERRIKESLPFLYNPTPRKKRERITKTNPPIA
jgi:hypothetical protein